MLTEQQRDVLAKLSGWAGKGVLSFDSGLTDLKDNVLHDIVPCFSEVWCALAEKGVIEWDEIEPSIDLATQLMADLVSARKRLRQLCEELQNFLSLVQSRIDPP